MKRCVLAFALALATALPAAAQNDPSAPALKLTKNSGGRYVVQYQGDAGYSAQLETSTDLSTWRKNGLPFSESTGQIEIQIPLPLLTTGRAFFRIARQPLVTSPVPTTPGFYTTQTFVHGGITRNYFLRVPATWSASGSHPLVFLLPGHGQSATEFSGGQDAFLDEADARGWISVVGQATETEKSFNWFPFFDPNTATEPYHAEQPYVDDAAYLLALVDYLKTSALQVNPARIYVAGFSNGGSMTHHLAAQPNHPFAAFAIMESGNQVLTFYPEPYDPDFPESGVRVPAKLGLPWQARPVILMNMVPSRPWQFEGRLISPDLFFNGARHNVARWTAANGYGSVAQPYPEPPLPPATSASSSTFGYLRSTWSASGTDRARCAYNDMRPDEGWPADLASQPDWNMALASLFPYSEPLVPATIRVEYPHTIKPDPDMPATRIRLDSGTRTIEFWRIAAGDRTNEVIFVGLSDGGHQWPGPAEGYPFSNIDVLNFFDAH